jgi:uncharacterized protein with HEPN domain
MSEATPREWRFYIDDMIACAMRVRSYTSGLDQASLVDSQMAYDAAIRNLELIGEAATHIPESVRVAQPQIPWRQIVATRNRLIHGYLGIDVDTLWSIIERDIPALIEQLQRLKKQLQE